MPQIITSIDAQTHHEYTGDVHVTCNIGEGATVAVYDGNLIIDGDIAQNCRILVTSQDNPLLSAGGRNYNSSSINISIGSSNKLTLKVGGLVGDNCTLTINNGDIHTQGVGEHTSLTANNGDIESGDIAQHSKLQANNGNVTASILGEKTKAVANNGTVRVQQAPKSAFLQANNGKVYENGVLREQENAVPLGGFTWSNGSSSITMGRITINGKEMTPNIQLSGLPYPSFSGAPQGTTHGTGNTPHHQSKFSMGPIRIHNPNDQPMLLCPSIPGASQGTAHGAGNAFCAPPPFGAIPQNYTIPMQEPPRPVTCLQAPKSLLTTSTTRIALEQNESREQVARRQGLNAQQSLVEEQKINGVKTTIEQLLKTLQSKIQDVKLEKRNTKTTIGIAEELYETLQKEQTTFEKDLNASNYETHIMHFKTRCTTLIKEARPKLEEDLGFGDILNSMLRVINGLINTLSGGKYPKFFSRTNKLSEAVDEFADQVEKRTGPNKV